jgi:sulfur carrier protein ThiS
MGIDSMKIQLKTLPENTKKEIDIKSGSKIIDLIRKINLKPDSIVVLNDTIPVPIDDELTENQKLTIIKVSSGG